MLPKSRFKILLSLVVSVIFIILPEQAHGQLIDMGQPVSWKGKLTAFKNITIEEMPGFDLDQMLFEDSVNNQMKSNPWRFGYNHEVRLSLENSGSWIELPNGDRVWQLHVKSPGAKSINFIFDDFFIPEGAYMHMYNIDRSHLVGAYTSILNNEYQILGTEIVRGDHVIIEYYEPKSLKGTSKLTIGTVTHAYRELSTELFDQLKDLNDSGDCNIDVNCPLGIGWQDQINSVGLTIVGGNHWCSGALINNTLEDGRPLFLTANHCLGNPANWVFRFNWDSPNPSCATTTPSTDGPFNQTVFTGTLLASSSSSDFALVEINGEIPSSWPVYYAGWDRTDIAPEFTIGIHHPAGDIKKICKDEDAPYHSTSGSAQVWWIDEWEEGVTESGSSGSPLFDPDGRIIGQLFGGLAACSNNPTTQNNGLYDFYGRFATSWDGSSPSSRLRDHLDPLNLAPMVFDGYDPQGPGLDIDIALISTGQPEVAVCDDMLLLSPCIRNLGNETVTSFTLVIELDGAPILTHDWSGELDNNEQVCIDLNAFSLPPGESTLTMTVHSPNGLEDENPNNNVRTFDVFMIHDGEEVVLTIELDCWGSEITWIVEDENGVLMAEGGPYMDNSNGELIEHPICLNSGCFTFTIFDAFGDGLYGSQYSTCSIDGDYFMTDADGHTLFQMDAPNGDFGESASHQFCIEGSSIIPDFAADTVELCASGSVSFLDLSIGTDLTSWEWTFEGGTPSTSNDQNPIVTYFDPGVYSVTLTVSDGDESASITREAYITVHDLPDITLSVEEDFECAEECTGVLSASVNGGLEPYTIDWSNGMNGDLITGVCFNPSFTATITDSRGCQREQSIEIEQEGQWFIQAVIDANCDDLTQCISIEINGDAPQPITIMWDDDDTNEQERCNLPGGTYTVTVVDADGCTNFTVIELDDIDPIEASIEIAHESCQGACDGSASVFTNAAAPFTLQWIQLESSQETVSNLCAGVYDVIITDRHGCIFETSAMINEGDPIQVTSIYEPTNCLQATTCVEVTATGGLGDYSYQWSNGSEDDNVNCNYGSGEHSVLVQDASGCETLHIFVVDSIENPTVEQIVTIHETCVEACDGSITVEAEGFGELTYTWSDADLQGAVIGDLCPDEYAVTITDENGCETTVSTEVLVGNTKPVALFELSDTIALIGFLQPQITNLSENADRYEWDFGDGNTSEEFEPQHDYDSVGTYTILLTAYNGDCIDTFSRTIIVDMEVSVQSDIHFGNIKIFPNPTDHRLFIKFDQPIMSTTTFELVTSAGVPLSKIVHEAGSNNVELSVGAFPAGLYYLKISDREYRIMRKVIVQH